MSGIWAITNCLLSRELKSTEQPGLEPEALTWKIDISRMLNPLTHSPGAMDTFDTAAKGFHGVIVKQRSPSSKSPVPPVLTYTLPEKTCILCLPLLIYSLNNEHHLCVGTERYAGIHSKDPLLHRNDQFRGGRQARHQTIEGSPENHGCWDGTAHLNCRGWQAG